MSPALLALLFAYLFLANPTESQTTEGWSPWEQWESCSRSCGRGVARRRRQCTESLTGGCEPMGADRQFRLCNIQSCAPGSKDFRAVQCSRYDSVLYDGKQHTWLPYVSSELNACELFCLSEREKFYASRNPRVVDGTACGDSGVCVEGACRAVGCDGVFDSDRRFDKCGVCGGDDSTCIIISDQFTDTNVRIGEYNLVTRIGAGAFSVRIDEIISTANSLAIADASGTFIINGNFQASPPGTYRGAGTVFVYSIDSNGRERITAEGPLQQQIIVYLLCREGNQGVSYSYARPIGPPPPPPTLLHSFRTGEYSKCDLSCGGGTQSRSVECVNIETNSVVDDSFCTGLLQPVNSRACSSQPCPAVWFVAGDWSSCSATCGGGQRSRDVVCRRGEAEVEDDECRLSVKPRSTRTCGKIACPSWRTGTWTSCSKTCGDGQRRRNVICYDPRRNRAVSDKRCLEELRPVDEEPCNLPKCTKTFSWHASSWSECTATCGQGIQTRNVECIVAGKSGSVRPDEDCRGQLKPNESRLCVLEPCGAQWLVSDWSRCSQTCGCGARTRSVRCVGVNCSESGACDSSARPPHLERCSVAPCRKADKPDTDRPNSVTVRVGDTFRVSCSASSLPPQRPTIRWTRNGRLLPGTFRRVAVPTVSEQLDSGEILETRTLIVSDVVRADAGSYVCTIGRETPLKQTTILSVAGRRDEDGTVEPSEDTAPADCIDSNPSSCRRLVGLCRYNDVKRSCCRSCWGKS
ncbi:A disintegrin and metalloproteinase with thrombospondin motifs 18-like isoform X2 [Oscarella lobularis]|uniref:A disintegrin and metalloproteinase with thrombospondin motifs 18-like isoform X2 n=1 Tax=Oscarella lobularis TaxID=121494 RepID=UPI0033135FF5